MIEEAPEHVDDPDCPYDPNDPQAVEAFWKDAVFVPGGGPTTIGLDPDVLKGLRAAGKGWQTRANQVLREWLGQRAK